MYEINLVPDIKAELLKKRKIQYLVIFICICVAGGCAAILAVLGGTLGTVAGISKAKESKITCQINGGPSCNVSRDGQPIMQTENLNELLTIQDQMKNLESLNSGKIRFSRVFGILDILLLTESDPDPDENNPSIAISELHTDFSKGVTLSFDAKAYDKVNNIGFSVVEAFKKNAKKIYYDYGSYMRKDKETGEFVEIPSYCILKEERDEETGITYGTYVKGIPGCELDMVKKVSASEGDNDLEGGEESEKKEEYDIYDYIEEIDGQVGESICEREDLGVECVKIRRTYIDESDKNLYKEGTDNLAKEDEMTVNGYYFESACLSYGSDGKIDEKASLEKCPLLSEEMKVSQPTQSRDDDGNMIVRFNANVPISRKIFEDRANHVTIIGPTRQNVTDSYVQIREMFVNGEAN